MKVLKYKLNKRGTKTATLKNTSSNGNSRGNKIIGYD